MMTAPLQQALVSCPRCGHALGTTNGQRLYIGAAVLTRPVTLFCAVCGERRPWQPERPLDSGGQSVQP